MLQTGTQDWSINAMYAFDVVAGEFVVVTAEVADIEAYTPLQSLLRRVRNAFGVEAAFISEWAEGAPLVHRHDDADEEDATDCHPLHVHYGRQLLGCGGTPPAGFHAVPVLTPSGMHYGTLCCLFPADSRDEKNEAEALRSVARLISDWFDDAELSLSRFMPLTGHSVMGSLPAMLC